MLTFASAFLREAVRPTRGNSHTELYEGSRPRKVLITDPSEVRQLEGAWVAHNLLMMDLRDKTQTRLVVESIFSSISRATVIDERCAA